MFLVLFLMSCAHVQLDLTGWASYLQVPVVMTDDELSRVASGHEADNEHLSAIQWRQERCRLKGWTCTTEVRVFRNQHSGQGHLKVADIQTKLGTAGITSPVLTEQLDVHPGGGNSCYVVMRVLRQE